MYQKDAEYNKENDLRDTAEDVALEYLATLLVEAYLDQKYEKRK